VTCDYAISRTRIFFFPFLPAPRLLVITPLEHGLCPTNRNVRQLVPSPRRPSRLPATFPLSFSIPLCLPSLCPPRGRDTRFWIWPKQKLPRFRPFFMSLRSSSFLCPLGGLNGRSQSGCHSLTPIDLQLPCRLLFKASLLRLPKRSP